jgi:hypothetical protein
MARMEAAAPTKRANPRGPGERFSARLRSASKTAKAPQKRPKQPKAANNTGRERVHDLFLSTASSRTIYDSLSALRALLR